jgi:hypothetical protein
MPPKEARVRCRIDHFSQAIFPRMVFCFEEYKSGTQEWKKGVSDIEGKVAMGRGEETTATEFQKRFLFLAS